jgi:hypothetical protein
VRALEWVGFAAGILVISLTNGSVLTVLIVPRARRTRLTRMLARGVIGIFQAIARRFRTYEAKDRIIAFQAPTYMVVLLATWLALYLTGFALLFLPFTHRVGTALLASGESLTTLGAAVPLGTGPAIVASLAAIFGLVVVALQIAYLPVLYGAFNRREALVTLLESRAGAPAWGPEILIRHQAVQSIGALGGLYDQWEAWAADVAETHTNYPPLVYFRSPDPLRSWVVGLVAVMDAAALHLALAPDAAPAEARMVLRMGFTCLRQVAGVFSLPFDPDPRPAAPITLSFEEFVGAVRLIERAGFPISRPVEEAWPHFRGWRVNYEEVAYALADRTVSPPGPWTGPRTALPDVVMVPRRPADRTPDDPDAREDHGRKR